MNSNAAVAGTIYADQSGARHLFKVGKTNDYDRRHKEHATSNPDPLVPFGRIDTEHYSKGEAYLKGQLRLYLHIGKEGKFDAAAPGGFLQY